MKLDVRFCKALAAAGCALLWLASCGGGSQVQRYVPTRVLAFGDETSVIEADGRKYSVNALQADGVTPDCVANPLWVQSLATAYGLTFTQCPGTAAAPASRIFAKNGAKVADIAAQVSAAGGTFASSDLATVLVGANDVIELYLQYDGSNAASLSLAAEARGTALAGQIIALSQAGAKVLFSTIFDMGQTPYGLAQEAAFPGTGRAALLSSLTERLNAKLRTGVSEKLGGNEASQMLADEQAHAIVSAVATSPNAATYLNATVPICDPAQAVLPACTTKTLITTTSTPALLDGGTATNYLWADERHLSSGGQLSLGSLAIGQINRTPL